MQRSEKNANTKSVYSFAKYDSHLKLLSNKFQEKFCDFSSFEHCFALFSAPFKFKDSV